MAAMRDPVLRALKWTYGEQGAGEGWASWFDARLRAQRWSGRETLYIRDGVWLALYVNDGSIGGQELSRACTSRRSPTSSPLSVPRR